MAHVRGLDVSSCQGAIDFDKLVSGAPWCRFLVVKCAEGETGLDPTRVRNMQEAAKRGLLVFAYFFFRSSQDAHKQAQNFIASVGGVCPPLVFIDFETIADGLTPEQAAVKLRALWVELRAALAMVGVYLYPYFERGTLHHALAAYPELADGPLWMADYSGGESPPDTWSPYVAPPWKKWSFAQTSGNDSSAVPGIPGHVDHNVFNGTEDELRVLLGLGGQGETPAPTVHPDVDMPAPDYSNGDG